MGAASADGPVPLYRHRPFVLLCGEQVASSVGRQITALALTLLAVTGLGAGPFGAAALLALTYLPGAVLSPLAGALVDRIRLRRLLVWVTSLQTLVVGSIPFAGAVGHITLPQLYVVAAVSGTLTFTLSVALQAALPRVVGPERLLGANSALTAARTSGQIGGPALGGVMVGLLGADSALLAGSAAYAVEALFLLALPAALNTPAGSREPAKSVAGLLRTGLAVVRAERRLRRMVLAGAGLNLGSGAATALYVFYATHDLALPAWQLGTTYATYSAATLAGALLAGRFARTTGLWRATQIFGLAAGAAVFLIPAASLGLAFPVLLAYQVCYGLSGTVWMISMTTTQQLVTPDGMQGRVAGLVQAVLLTTVPVGALAGGALAAWLGSVPVLMGSAAVTLLSAATLWAPTGTSITVAEPAADAESRR
ncbi:MFS transporter [Streptomyces sp. NBC_01142]|uniref:MFS transporter n=1 Tax=Streptomyces sp. NBC_01142 TaxID=2975865 RepID=UPI00225564D2|nr:MFS transporter [Streptomyces sp. NBC_01142]MCX4821051.1 MFS transporter [Streptomyces sp. NBC_01142]